MTKEKATEFFAEFYRGDHHIPRSGIKPFGDGWCVNHGGDLSTWDFNDLTRLVFLAHDSCVRVSIIPSGSRVVKIAIWQREGREGRMSRRHPTIEQAEKSWRANHPLEEKLCTETT